MAEDALDNSGTQLVVGVVDDDESLRRSVANLLSSVGIVAVVFGSAEEFITAPQPATFSCVLLDIYLPGISGLVLLAKMPPAVPVIMLTAHDDRNLRDKATLLGAFAFLTKPFSASELVDTIKKAFAATKTKPV